MYDRVLILPSRAMHAAVAPRLEEGQAAFYRAEGLVGQRTRELRFMGTEAYWKRQPEFAQITCRLAPGGTMIFDNSQGCTSSVRTFRVPAVVEKEVIIPDSIGDEYSPAGRIVTAWLEERLFGFSMDLRRELYHDEYAVVEHAVNSLTALYRAAELAIATNRS